MSLLAISMLVWAFAAANAVSWSEAATSGSGVRFWLLLTYAGTLAFPVAVMVMALQYTNRGALLTPRTYILLAAEPVATVLILATDPFHKLFFGGQELTATLSHGGPWFWINAAYSIGLIAVAVVLLGREIDLTVGRRIYRAQTGTMIVALIIPSIALYLSIEGLSPVPDIDLTPLSFILTGFLLAFALLRLGLFTLIPIARDQLVEEMHEGVVVFDAADNIVDINPAALRLLELTNDCLGKNAHQVLSGRKEMAVALQAGVRSVEFQTESDPARFVEVSAAAVREDRSEERIATLLTLRDVTERKNDQMSLAESEQRLARVLEGANLGAWDWNLETDRVDFNERWFEMLGYASSELPHSLATWELLMHPDDAEMAMAAVQAHIDGETSQYECTHRLRAKSGEWRWILDRGRTVAFSSSGKPIRMAGTHLDVTERVLIEQALRHNEALLSGLAEATQHLLAGASLADSDVAAALACLGEAAAVDRVYIFEHESGEGRGFCSQRVEWTRGNTEAQINNPDLQHVSWDDIAPRWYDTFVVDGFIAGNVADFPQDERLLLEPQGILSLLVLPIWSADRLWGFVGFDMCASLRIWEPSEIALLRAMANSLGAAIDRQRLAVSEHEQRVFAEGLRDAAAAVNSTLDFDGLLDRIFESLVRVVECESASVMLLEPADGSVRVVRSPGYARHFGDTATEELPPRRVSETATLKRMFHTRQPIVVVDADVEPMWAHDDALVSVRSYVAAPIFIDDEPIGFLTLESAVPGRFEEKHAQQVSALANQAAAAIDKSRLHERLRQLAITDTLTGVFNRRGFAQLAEHVIASAKRSRRSTAVAVVDVDHFKTVNDRYGHTVGDKVLCTVAACCLNHVRAVDVVARFGGDEFVILFPETDGEEANLVAERICKAIFTGSPAFVSLGVRVNVSVCVGVAAQLGPDTDLDLLLTTADNALYAAKEAGRNRVVMV